VTSLSHQDNVGSNLWWLKETKGFTNHDKCILSFLKIVYLGTRFLLKITLGKERTNSICIVRISGWSGSYGLIISHLTPNPLKSHFLSQESIVSLAALTIPCIFGLLDLSTYRTLWFLFL